MAKNRKAAMKVLTDILTDLTKDNQNADYWNDHLGKLSDKDFDQFLMELQTGEDHTKIYVYAPNYSEVVLDTKNNVAVAKKYGVELYTKITVTPSDDTAPYTIPHEVMVLEMPVRRASQAVLTQMNTAKDNKSIDQLTGQPAGDSATGKLSLPEIPILAGFGFTAGLEEALKYRGGDIGGFSAYNRMIAQTGRVSLDAIAPMATGVKSRQTLNKLLQAQYIGSNL